MHTIISASTKSGKHSFTKLTDITQRLSKGGYFSLNIHDDYPKKQIESLIDWLCHNPEKFPNNQINFSNFEHGGNPNQTYTKYDARAWAKKLIDVKPDWKHRETYAGPYGFICRTMVSKRKK